MQKLTKKKTTQIAERAILDMMDQNQSKVEQFNLCSVLPPSVTLIDDTVIKIS